jgi:hypothetical protein
VAFRPDPGSADTTPPTVAITAPAPGAQVADIVTVTADAFDDVGVVGVQFFVDAVATGAEDLVAPYGLSWDTRTLANGSHALTARARDAAGNTALSSPVTVNVANVSAFQNEILATGFDLPTSIEFLPDGRLLVIELAGTILILPPPYVQPDPTPFLQLTNVGNGGVQQGLMDVVLDPAFGTNHFYYVFYTLGSPNRDRLSRFTANATNTGTIPGSEVVLYQDPVDANAEHHGGALAFGNDGKLYFTTGEHFDPAESQGPVQPQGEDPPDQQGRVGPHRQPVLRRGRAPLGLDLGARAPQPVPGLLRRADGAVLRRRRGRERGRHGQGGDQSRRARRELRMAGQRGELRPAVHQPDLHLRPQRA